MRGRSKNVRRPRFWPPSPCNHLDIRETTGPWPPCRASARGGRVALVAPIRRPAAETERAVDVGRRPPLACGTHRYQRIVYVLPKLVHLRCTSLRRGRDEKVERHRGHVACNRLRRG